MEFDVKISFSSIYDRLISEYGEDKERYIVDALEYAVNQYRRLSGEIDKTSFDNVEENWLKRACFEYMDRRFVIGVVGGIKQYSENGYQFTLDGTEISNALANEILPYVGVVK